MISSAAVAQSHKLVCMIGFVSKRLYCFDFWYMKCAYICACDRLCCDTVTSYIAYSEQSFMNSVKRCISRLHVTQRSVICCLDFWYDMHIYILYEGLYCIFDIGYILWCVDWTGLYVIVKCRTAHFICHDITQPRVICFFLNVFIGLFCLHMWYMHYVYVIAYNKQIFFVTKFPI